MDADKEQKLLISSSVTNTIYESSRLASKLNVGLEISRLPLYKDRYATVKDVTEQIREEIKDFGNRITLHAMFSDVNVAGSDCLLTEISKLRYRQSYEIGKEIGADTILFHTGNKGTKYYGSQEQFKKKYIKFWKEFIKQFEDNGIIAVIENVFEETPNYCLEILYGVDSSNFKLALDTGHVNLYAPNTKVTDWIKAYGNNLYHMHIHNNYGQNDDHSNLSDGTLNFKEIFKCIKETGINPSYVFEMYNEDDIMKSYQIFKENNN